MATCSGEVRHAEIDRQDRQPPPRPLPGRALSWAAALAFALSACGGGGATPPRPNLQGTLQVVVEPRAAMVSVAQGGTVVGILQGSGTFDLPAGSYQATATATDHEPQTVPVTITARRTTPLAFDLTPVSRMRFEGEWVWVVAFSSNATYEGFLSVSTALDDSSDGSIRNAEGGVWRWCVFGVRNCPNPTGVGFFADYQDQWMVAFSEVPTFIKLIGFDRDGELEFDEDGRPMFIGVGNWYFASGSRAVVGVGLARVSGNPTFRSSDALGSSWPELTDGAWPTDAAAADAADPVDLRSATRQALLAAVERATD
jgi:hypothetical protein